jgi:NAD-dependent deacetylase
MTDDLTRARSLVANAGRIVVLTGAGVSAESGVPTFRGPKGLWKSFRPEELATPQAFSNDPCLVWEWYEWRRGLVADCTPNSAHTSLAELALRQAGRTLIVTQNVDGLHHRAARQIEPAAPDPAFPLEVHGAIHRDRCSDCGLRTEAAPGVDVSSLDTLPRCLECGGLLRPDVVWYGESLDPEVIATAFDAARTADVCLVVGTSSLVYPAASIPEVTLQSGGQVIEINLEPTPLSDRASLNIWGEAGKLVPYVVD